MPEIRFDASESVVKLLNPVKGFSEEAHVIEVRRDPLLGDKSIFNPAIREKVRFFFGSIDQDLIERLVSESTKNCVFCEKRIETSTPRYPEYLISTGRLRVGEAVLFPNLYPAGRYHSVIVLSKAHFLRLTEFTPDIIGNGLRAAQSFVRRVFDIDREAMYVALNANYLFTAGATLVHPHLQMLITSTPYSYHDRLINACGSYRRKNGSDYYSDLIEEERKIGSRYIAKRGAWHWMAAFSPTGVNEINAVHESETDFGMMSDSDLDYLSDGISRVLRLYDTLGHLCFNYTIYSTRKSASEEGSRCLLKMISRQNPYPNYRNDDYFLQKLLQTELIINLPEELAVKMQKIFEEA